MSTAVSGKLGKRGTLVIPAELRRRYGLREGSMFIAEATDQGILIKPAVAVPVEVYTPERKAEFLLSTAVDEADYVAARAVVEELGLDPDAIEHHRP
ncbi:MAG: AbrB/MazE/SpoVT family DNA-binding domain-containing protein [Trueperaceae bacterium]|nr:AbrB/MazE/SpoVT family DNA-binding domain-containing protein [Trueperaceae bacterium]